MTTRSAISAGLAHRGSAGAPRHKRVIRDPPPSAASSGADLDSLNRALRPAGSEVRNCAVTEFIQATFDSPAVPMLWQPDGLARRIARTPQERNHGVRAMSHFSETVTPPLNAESCSSSEAGVAPAGMS
ncbi:hypothetical protein GCM10027579_09060 [Calidifontibacter terrae]